MAPEPISRLVQEAWAVGQRAQLDPTLILAIMAVESSFNPFAQSSVGAQGLMQVMTRIHDDKYLAFGGNHAAFDPLTNLRVGVQVLKECIARAGSLEDGLRFYVGAANLADDGGYASKVLSEQAHLRQVAAGKSVAITVPQSGVTVPVRATTAAPPTADASVDAPAQPERPAPAAASEQLALLRLSRVCAAATLRACATGDRAARAARGGPPPGSAGGPWARCTPRMRAASAVRLGSPPFDLRRQVAAMALQA